MEFEDPWIREGKSSPIEFERRMYEQTNNPIHAWRAHEICCELMRASAFASSTLPATACILPAWVISYFETATEGIRQVFNAVGDEMMTDEQMIKGLAEALAFKEAGRGLRRNAFKDCDLEHRRQMLASMVWQRLQGRPNDSIEAIAADVEDQLEEAADSFEERRRNGDISSNTPPSAYETRASARTILDAWRDWREFLMHSTH